MITKSSQNFNNLSLVLKYSINKIEKVKITTEDTVFFRMKTKYNLKSTTLKFCIHLNSEKYGNNQIFLCNNIICAFLFI